MLNVIKGIAYHLNIKDNLPIAGFDLDGTIIFTKSGKKYPIDENDWKPNNEMIEKMNTIKNYNIVIFTNQKNLTEKLGISKFKIKIENILKLFNKDLNISIIISLEDDYYRKPLTGMFEFINEKYKINKDKSYFVGDAAGREGDHSNSDLYFAINNDIKFYTPEDYVKGKESKLNNEYIKINEYVSDKKVKIKGNNEGKEIVILVGLPGCGKSTFSKKYYNTYEYVNQDTEKTKQKVINKITKAINSEKNIIVDNTNLDEKYRNEILKIVPETYNIKFIIFDIPVDVCRHMMYYRVNKDKTDIINIIIYRTMKKRYLEGDKIKVNEDELEEEYGDRISIYRINKIYANKEDKEKIIKFRASLG